MNQHALKLQFEAQRSVSNWVDLNRKAKPYQNKPASSLSEDEEKLVQEADLYWDDVVCPAFSAALEARS